VSSPTLERLESRDVWLAERRRGVGASEVAAILGVDPRRGPLAVYASKLGAPDTEEETRWMRRGRRLEAVIADEYADETKRTVRDLGAYTLARHATLPFFFATQDREVVAPEQPGPGPLEAKAVWAGKADLWDIEPPVEFQVQLQAQMACSGAEWGSLVALIGGLRLWFQDVQRNDRFIAAMTTSVEAFWERVEKKQPPAPDATEGTLRAIRALYPKDAGTTIALPPEFYQIAQRIDVLKEEIKAREAEQDTAEAHIKLALGDNTWGALTDGSRFQWRVEPRKGYVVDPSEPRVLRRVGRPKVGKEKK